MEGIYRIAERTILIRTLHERMHREAAAFAAEGPVDFTVEITQAEIDAERARNRKEADETAVPVNADAYIETLAVYRKIAEQMPSYDTVLFHSSAVAVDGAAYLFAAKSGTGKSTHARLWRELLGDRAIMINDDKPLLRITDAGATVFGTPWNGKHRLGTNGSAPVRAICVLERGAQNHIERIGPKEAYPILLQQTYRPDSREAMLQTLTLLDRLLKTATFYRLFCNMEPEAARLSYETMKGNEP